MHRKTARLAFDKVAAQGPAAGSLVVLHGLFGSKANFRSLAKRPELSGARDVYLVDMRNHGESEHVDSHSVRDMAADVERFLDERGLEKAVLLGHSMGGKVAIQAALDLQDRVEGLLVGDAGPFDYNTFTLNNTSILELMAGLDLKSFHRKEDLQRVFVEHLGGNKLVADFLMTNVVGDPAGGLRWRINVSALARDYRRYSGYVPGRGQTYRGPTNVLYGTRSEYMPRERFGEFKAWFPELDVERDFKAINGGHWIHFADPEAFLKHVDGFLKSLA